jgi:UrcA family protein
MKTLVTGTALLFAITLPCGAQAQTAVEAGHAEAVAVAYADLDLNQPAANRLLNNRLRSAALRVCGDANLVHAAPRARHWCVRDAVQDGWNQVAAHREVLSAESRNIMIAALRTRPRP